MTIWFVVEHYPYLINEGYNEVPCVPCLRKERAEEIAKEYNKEYAPYWYTVERCEVEP